MIANARCFKPALGDISPYEVVVISSDSEIESETFDVSKRSASSKICVSEDSQIIAPTTLSSNACASSREPIIHDCLLPRHSVGQSHRRANDFDPADVRPHQPIPSLCFTTSMSSAVPASVVSAAAVAAISATLNLPDCIASRQALSDCFDEFMSSPAFAAFKINQGLLYDIPHAVFQLHLNFSSQVLSP